MERSLDRGDSQILASRRASMGVLLLIALLARLDFALIVGPLIEGDTFAYEHLALNLARGAGYVDTRPFKVLDAALVRPPAYPAFLAAVFGVLGHNHLYVALVQQLLACLTVLACAWIASRLFTMRIAFWFGMALTFHPTLCLYGNVLLTETLFTFLLSVSTLLGIESLRRGRLTPLVGSGILLGTSCLCRPSFLLFPLFALPIVTAGARRFQERVLRGLCYVVPMILIITPWVARNRQIYGYAGLSPLGGINLLKLIPMEWLDDEGTDEFRTVLAQACEGRLDFTAWEDRKDKYYSSYSISRRFHTHCTFHAIRILTSRGYGLAEINRRFGSMAIRGIARNPLGYARIGLSQTGRLWSGNETRPLKEVFREKLARNKRIGQLGTILMRLFSHLPLGLILACLAAIGCCRIIARREWLAYVLIAMVVYDTAVNCLLTTVELRYRVPVEPYLLMVAVSGAVAVASWCGSSRILHWRLRR